MTTRAGALAFSRSSSRSVSRNGARWLTANVCSRPSAVTWRAAQNPPTLLTRTSSRGHASSTSAARRRTSAWDDMSAPNAMTFGLFVAARMSSAAASARRRSRPVTTSRAPSAASPIAVALPMPDVPPVTRTVLPVIDSGWWTMIDPRTCRRGAPARGRRTHDSGRDLCHAGVGSGAAWPLRTAASAVPSGPART